MEQDTKPTHDTIREMAAVTPPLVIPAGGARAALIQASARLASAIGEYTAVAEAVARALDEQDAGVRAARDALNATVGK